VQKWCSGRRRQRLETAALIRDNGAQTLCDPTSDEAEVRLVEKTIAIYGRLAFNNAGIFELPIKPLHEQSIEDFDKLMSINVRLFFVYEI